MKNKFLMVSLLILLSTVSAGAKELTMTVTAFTLSHKETGGRTQKTALMTKPIPGWSVAVSRDKIGMLGRKVYIDGIGVRRIDSLTSKKLKNTVDVLVGNKKEARKMGKSKRLVVIL